MLSFDASTHVYTLHDSATPSAWGRVLPSVTQVLHAVGLVDDEYFTEEHRTRGRYVHKAVLYDEREGLDDSSIDPRLAGYIEAYRRFKQEAQPGPCELIEQPLCDPVRRVAGTPDQVRAFQGERSLFDIKSGGPARWHCLQTSCYEALVRLALDCGPMRRYALYVRRDGTYRLEEHTDRNDLKTFYAALTVAQWREAQK